MNERSKLIDKLLRDRDTRAAYVQAKLAVLLPAQIKALRLRSAMQKQSDLAEASGMHQSRISMFETPGGANLTLETLARLAGTFGTGLVVKFVPLSEMLRWENSFSPDAFNVIRIGEDSAFLNPTAAQVDAPRFTDISAQRVLLSWTDRILRKATHMAENAPIEGLEFDAKSAPLQSLMLPDGESGSGIDSSALADAQAQRIA